MAQVDSEAKRVLIVDADSNVRAALRLLLARQANFRVIGEAHEAAGLQLSLAPDVVLLDWQLRPLLETLRTKWSKAQVIVLSLRDEHRDDALAAGAQAFVSKCEAPGKVLETLRKLSQPGVSGSTSP